MERVHSLAIIDDQGNWLTSPGTIGSTLSDDAFFRHHQLRSKREPYVGRPVKSLLDGEWVVTLSRRFNKPDGQLRRRRCSRPSAPTISRTSTSSSRSAATAPSALMYGDGLIIARNPEQRESSSDATSADTPLFRDASLQRPSGAYHFKSPLDGAERLSFFKRSSRYPLVLLAPPLDKEELLAPWRAAAISRMLYVLALVMLIAIIGAVLVRQLQRGAAHGGGPGREGGAFPPARGRLQRHGDPHRARRAAALCLAVVRARRRLARQPADRNDLRSPASIRRICRRSRPSSTP